MLLEKYGLYLTDSRPNKELKEWEWLLFMIDSTTISLFDNLIKGIGRNPKCGKNKGGLKVHTVMRYIGVPMVVQLTSAAKHDHYLHLCIHSPADH